MVNLQKSLDKSFLILNKIRLTFIVFILSLCGFIFIKSLYCLIYICILSLFFIVMFVFYIPSYYNSFKYLITEEYIIIFSGVIFTKKILLKIDSITKIGLYQTWLQRILKIKSLILFSPGQTTLISCLNIESIDDFLKKIDRKII